MQSFRWQSERGAHDTDGCHRHAAIVEQRRRDGAGAGGIFALHEIAASTREFQRAFEHRASRRRQRLEQRPHGNGFEVRSNGAAQRAFPPCAALPHIGGQANRLPAFGGITDHAGVAGEDPELHGLLRHVAQRREFGRGGGAQVQIRPDAVRQFEQPIAKLPRPVGIVASQEAAALEGCEQAVQRGAGQAGALHEVGKTGRRRRRRDEVE